MPKFRVVTILFLSLINFLGYSQGIEVKSFSLLENDLTARTQPVIDQNGDKCALIKIVTSEKGFYWEPDMLGIVKTEKHVGEYWLYVPHQAKRLTIKHEQLGVLRNYEYPIPIDEAQVYEMVLTTDRVKTVVEEREIPTQWVLISSEPSGADVYINDQYKGQTPWQGELEEGEYTYRIEKNLYYPDAGKTHPRAKGEKVEIHSELKGNFGFVKVKANPTGAEVRIDDQLLDKRTPMKSRPIKSGNYNLKLSHSIYYDTIIPISVTDGNTVDLDIKLRPAFATLEIKTKPEINAEVYIDNKAINKNTPVMISPMQTGKHMLMLRSKWYEPVKQIIKLEDGEQKKLKFEVKPIFADLNIKTTSGSEIFIDGQLKGKTTWQGRLVHGLHSVEIKKENYFTHKEQVQIKAEENKEMDIALKPKVGSIKIVGKPFKAKVYLNDKKIGVSPLTKRNIIIGNYQLRVELEGYATYTKNVVIEKDETETIKYNLASGRQVSISANKEGAQVEINGEVVGKTPFRGIVPYGEHDVKVVSKDFAAKQKIKISDDKHVFNLKLKHKKYKYLMYINGVALNHFQNSTPMGLKLGYLSKIGFYANIGLNKDFNLSSNYEYESGNTNITGLYETYYLVSDKAKYPAFVGIIGGSVKISSLLHAYLGGGYGYTKRYLKVSFYNENTNEIRGSDYMNIKADEVSKALLDIGFIVKYKFGVLNLGYNTLNFFNVGIGVNF